MGGWQFWKEVVVASQTVLVAEHYYGVVSLKVIVVE
jgi:hypothetical protein